MCIQPRVILLSTASHHGQESIAEMACQYRIIKPRWMIELPNDAERYIANPRLHDVCRLAGADSDKTLNDLNKSYIFADIGQRISAYSSRTSLAST